MARRFAKVSEEEIEEAFFYPSDLVNTKTTIPLRVGEERWIHTSDIYPPLFTSPLGDSCIIDQEKVSIESTDITYSGGNFIPIRDESIKSCT